MRVQRCGIQRLQTDSLGPVAITFSFFHQRRCSTGPAALREKSAPGLFGRERQSKEGEGRREAEGRGGRAAERPPLQTPPQSTPFRFGGSGLPEACCRGCRTQYSWLSGEKNQVNQDWSSTSRQGAHGPAVSPLGGGSPTSGHCGIVPLCQSASIQVTLQAPGLCLFSLGMASFGQPCSSFLG